MKKFNEGELENLALLAMECVEEMYKNGEVPTREDLSGRMRRGAGCSLTGGILIVNRMEEMYKTRLAEIGYSVKIPCSP